MFMGDMKVVSERMAWYLVRKVRGTMTNLSIISTPSYGITRRNNVNRRDIPMKIELFGFYGEIHLIKQVKLLSFSQL